MADTNVTSHNTDDKTAKMTKALRYKEAKAKSGFDLSRFCGVILAEDVAKAKKAMSIIGRNWTTGSVPFPKSDKAFDYIETELTEYLANMLDQLRSGSKVVVADLQPAPF
jgi:hypothetical protein